MFDSINDADLGEFLHFHLLAAEKDPERAFLIDAVRCARPEAYRIARQMAIAGKPAGATDFQEEGAALDDGLSWADEPTFN